MIRGTARAALLLVLLGLLQSATAQDFLGLFEKQPALLLAITSKMKLCTELGLIAGAMDQRRAAGMSLAQFKFAIEKQPVSFPQQLVTLVGMHVFERPNSTGTEVTVEVTLECEKQLTEQVAAKLAADMPEEERETVNFVMSDRYVPPSERASQDQQ